MEPFIITAVVWAIILVGLLGTVLPALPGVGLIFFGILLHAIFFGFEDIGIVTLVALGLVALFSMLFDFLASAYGASRFGSTRWGVAGSIVGGAVGLVIFTIPGLILGVFLGAATAEMIFARKDARQSFRAGLGSVLGFLGGTVLKLILGLAMIGIFAAKVYL